MPFVGAFCLYFRIVDMVFARLDIAALKATKTLSDATANTPAAAKAPALRQGLDVDAKADTHDARSRAELVAEQAAEQQLRQQTHTTAELTPTREYGGPKGLEPTRYGDWEKAGRCFDF